MSKLTELRDAKAEEYARKIGYGVEDLAIWDQLKDSFKEGFDCRDKIDNEALKLAVEALEKYKNAAFEIEGKVYKVGKPAEMVLAEIRKLRGE